ncbi:hypothetical protein L596_013971 [Steinernema carpocapsae]|uniref:Neural proliferation differentiation and control protein 1 n=1 Tax=Steinernema carpocapsae TaxID=34508 RepID=A0A4U5NAS9_STECR|nr:hypothetical protein L596_013971 [Steinernema carpocapsae]
MWRATLDATALLLLILGIANANFFSEGGSGRVGNSDQQQQDWEDYANELYKNRQPQPVPQEQEEFGGLDEAKFEELLKEVNQLNQEKLGGFEDEQYVPVAVGGDELAADDQGPIYRDNQYFEQPQPEQLEIDLEKTKSLGGVESEMGNQVPVIEVDEPKEEAKAQEEPKTPIVAQKKGQNEYVEFVEPIPMKASKSIESMEKRVVNAPGEEMSNRGFAGFTQSGNVMFLVAATVFVVATVTGGGIFYKVHQNRQQPPSDFSHYAPAGPGKDKRGGKRTGDDTLAYKAQLHHYQQTKQKIICGGEEGSLPQSGMESAYDDGAVTEEEEEENNFSVYECPGLAPTGDIEVQNPNFDNSNFRP